MTRPTGDANTPRPRPLIVHVIYRLGVGGLENGVVNLVNHLPAARYRHAIVCVTDYTEFRSRVRRPDVSVHALHKRDGHDPAVLWRAWRLFRRLRPDVVHTRNLAALELQLAAALAGVPARIHGEHGWDVFDPRGDNRTYQRLRRVYALLVHRFVPLSRQLEAYLVERVGIHRDKIRRIYNGVDAESFAPGGACALPDGFAPAGTTVIGTVGRMHGVKDQLTLVRAFLRLRELLGTDRERVRLVIIGDGPLRSACQHALSEAGAGEAAWLPGARDDVPALLRCFHLFVLPSTAEGISNTILEAMASGLPVVATRVGGNVELVADGETGALVPASDPDAMARVLAAYARDGQLRRDQAVAARRRIESEFSLARMLQAYGDLYDEILAERQPARFAAVATD